MLHDGSEARRAWTRDRPWPSFVGRINAGRNFTAQFRRHSTRSAKSRRYRRRAKQVGVTPGCMKRWRILPPAVPIHLRDSRILYAAVQVHAAPGIGPAISEADRQPLRRQSGTSAETAHERERASATAKGCDDRRV